MTPRTYRAIMILAVLLLTVVTSITGIAFNNWAEKSCLPYRGKETTNGQTFNMLRGLILCFFLFNLVGLVFLIRMNDYLVAYMIIIMGNILLILTLSTFLTVFLVSISPTKHKWEKDIVTRNGWDGVKEYLVRSKFYNHFREFGCCNMPTDCDGNKVQNEDCKRWGDENYKRCYLCNSCQTVIFKYDILYSKIMKIVAAIFIVLLAMIAIIQMVELWKNRQVQ